MNCVVLAAKQYCINFIIEIEQEFMKMPDISPYPPPHLQHHPTTEE